MKKGRIDLTIPRNLPRLHMRPGKDQVESVNMTKAYSLLYRNDLGQRKGSEQERSQRRRLA